MAAVYPGSVRSFTTKVNNVDIVDAAHPNVIQEEVVAIETTLGPNPQQSTTPSGAWTGVATNFVSVAARLAKIEKGVVGDVHTQYAKLVGGSVITPSGPAVVGLTVQASSTQTANLQEWKDASGTVVAHISPSGVLHDAGTTRDFDNIAIEAWVFG